MSYNLSAISSNTTGLLSLIQGINNVLMFGWMGVLILIAVTVITFMSFMYTTNDARKALSGSFFICFGLSLLLKAMSLIPDIAFYLSLLLSAGFIAFSFVGEGQ